MRTPILLAVIALVVLFLFNPEMEAFQIFAEEQSARILQQQTGDSDLGRMLSGVGASLVGSNIHRFTERQNYGVFSIYTIDLDGDDEQEEEWRFLGIAGQFLELERPASLQEENEESP